MCNEVFKVEYNSKHLPINLGKNKYPQYSLKSYTNRHLINDKNVGIKKGDIFLYFWHQRQLYDNLPLHPKNNWHSQ
jgi:hypothetical protein